MSMNDDGGLGESGRDGSDRLADDRDLSGDGRDGQQPYPVRTADGRELEGWPIRSDALLATELGLSLPLTAVIDGREIAVEAVYEVAGVEDERAARLSALQLPAGSLPVEGDVVPPVLDPDLLNGPGQGERWSSWCRLFPWLRGC